jgi:glycosyltransferase involved in cell wall biosynthesis
MKIAYLTSRYPAVSHTFIQREIMALRQRGVSIATFSVRRPLEKDTLGTEAKQEAADTRWLVPPPFIELVSALAWAFTYRPMMTLRVLGMALFQGQNTLKERLKWLAYFLEAVLLARWLHREKHDHLHCHFGNNGSSTGMLAARLAGVPFSLTCHGSELNEPLKFRLAEKVRQAAFVACVSHYGRARLMLYCPESDWDKLHIIRCGQPKIKKPCIRHSHEKPHILCVGRLSKEKGHPILLRALSILSNQNMHFRCTLVGDGPLRSSLEKSAGTLPADTITFTGSLPANKVAELYSEADVVTLPSLSEGVPVVLMEALARRRPVVATRVGGVSELVQHGRSGLLVSPGNAEELAEALRQVIEDPDEARKMGIRGARHLRTDFDLSSNTQRLIDLFESTKSATAVTTNEQDSESIKRWKWIPQNS